MVMVNACRPQSLGTVRITSSDPTKPPAIDPRYYTDPEDIRVTREGIRIAREVIRQKAFDGFRGSEHQPGAAAQSDKELDDYIRARSTTVYHPVGTCKMGSDTMAAVDDRLRVQGIDRLRVVDASVMHGSSARILTTHDDDSGKSSRYHTIRGTEAGSRLLRQIFDPPSSRGHALRRERVNTLLVLENAWRRRLARNVSATASVRISLRRTSRPPSLLRL